MKVAYPTSSDVCESNWERGFTFPPAFVEELKTKFPDWNDLHNALGRNDESMCWGLLFKYQNRLKNIKPSEIIEADDKNCLPEIVDRARQAGEMKQYLVELEKRHFPEKIKKREEEQERIRAEYEFMGY